MVGRRTFRAGHRYRTRNLRDLARDAALWITTERDASMIQPTWTGGAEVWVMRVDVAVDEGDALLDWVDSLLR